MVQAIHNLKTCNAQSAPQQVVSELKFTSSESVRVRKLGFLCLRASAV